MQSSIVSSTPYLFFNGAQSIRLSPVSESTSILVFYWCLFRSPFITSLSSTFRRLLSPNANSPLPSESGKVTDLKKLSTSPSWKLLQLHLYFLLAVPYCTSLIAGSSPFFLTSSFFLDIPPPCRSPVAVLFRRIPSKKGVVVC